MNFIHRLSEPLPSGFRACFVLKFPFQRGEGEKMEEMEQIKTNRPKRRQPRLRITVYRLMGHYADFGEL